MKKIIGAIIIAMMMMGAGCEKTKYKTDTVTEYVEVPAPIPPVVEPDPTIPDVGTGSLQYSPTCKSGFAYVLYVYESESTIDNNSFVILHSVNGNRQDMQVGSVMGNGSISRMEANVYISQNDTEEQIAHQVEVQYISNGVSQSQSFSFIQPTCYVEEVDDNVSMVVGIIN